MTSEGYDFKIQHINLDGVDIDAGQRMGMVLVQPQYQVSPDGQVSFRIAQACRVDQCKLIEQAFKIRASESNERRLPIPFILFPEVSIPVNDPDGLDCLRQQMEESRGDLVFIGGLEGLSFSEVQGLTDRFPPDHEFAKPEYSAGGFVNVCVIAVKSASGHLSWYFQAKLRPSKWEQPRNMAHGQRVLYFVSHRVAFLCQICFDHIAAEGKRALNNDLCEQLIDGAGSRAATLDFVFVPQCNPEPLHTSVKQNTRDLLCHQHRALKNEMTVIVVVNKAAEVQESSNYGRSGFHFREGRWETPKSELGPKAYELYDRDRVTSAVFRVRTHAIHVTTLVPQSFNTGFPGNPRLPLESPRSYLIGNGYAPAERLFLPGTPCADGEFVEYDCLPCKLHDVLLPDFPKKDAKKRWQASELDQTRLLEDHYRKIRESLLKMDCARACDLIYLLLLEHEPGESKNPDIWSDMQFEAVVELASALSVLAELYLVDFQTTPHWTAMLGESLALVLLDGKDKMYSFEEMVLKYVKKFEGQYHNPEARRKPVLLVALRSRGLVQPLVKLSSLDITKPTDASRFGNGGSFTKPTPLRIYMCQDALFEGARQANKIAEFLKHEMGCIFE